jgi:energy-coupling factor transporter ATP-binding protein EcfA2
MNYPIYFDSKNSQSLFGHQENFNFISNLYFKKKLPKVLMFSGNKGSGKATLINHFLYSIFDVENYNVKKLKSSDNSFFLNQFRNNIFPNIIRVTGADFKSVKIDDIRNLKKKFLQSTFSDKERFIIFDDIELFNNNSLNALLKTIEEPSKKNYFFLINNKSKPLLETIKSRALEIKIILSEGKRLEIIEKLVQSFKLQLILDPETSQLSPGNFIKYNYICEEYGILPKNDFVENLTLLLNLYKKNKDILFINLAIFIADYYFKDIKNKNLFKNDKIFEIKNYVFDNLNNFIVFNINQNSLINAISKKLNYE